MKVIERKASIEKYLKFDLAAKFFSENEVVMNY